MDRAKQIGRNCWLAGSLLAVVILLAGVAAKQWQKRADLEKKFKVLAEKKEAAARMAAEEARLGVLLAERKDLLAQYEQQIPYVDGYVWVSKLVREASPNLAAFIDPPEIGQEILRAQNYCTGSYRIHGTGTVPDLLKLLDRIESKVPFAHVQDIQFVMTEREGAKIHFAVSLLLVLQLHHDNSPNLHVSLTPSSGAIP